MSSTLFLLSSTILVHQGFGISYSVHLICISTYLDDSKLQNKLCDDVINMEVSVEELLEEDEHLVPSTDVTPVKLTPPTKCKGSVSSRVLKISKQLKEAEILGRTHKALDKDIVAACLSK